MADKGRLTIRIEGPGGAGKTLVLRAIGRLFSALGLDWVEQPDDHSLIVWLEASERAALADLDAMMNSLKRN